MTDTDTATEQANGLPTLNLTGDPVDDLTLPELRVINGKLRADAVHAITHPTADRWDALALVAWIHAKRQDPTAKLAEFTRLSVAQLGKVLSWERPDTDLDDGDGSDDVVEVGPTLDEVSEKAAADPTAPTV